MENVILTARINKKILEECKELGINVSETVCEALLKKLAQEKEQRFRKLVSKASVSAKKLNIKTVVRQIRRMREER